VDTTVVKSKTRQAAAKTERAAESPWAEGLARAGLVAKGITFGLVGALALNVAISGHGKVEDRTGALRTVAQNGFGRALLVALAVGLAGYALWQLALGVLGKKLETGEKEGALRRIMVLGRGLLYSWLAVLCVLLVVNSHEQAAGGGKGEQHATSTVFDWPLGRWLVAAVGLAVVGVGAFNLYRARSGKFRKDLKEGQMGNEERRWYTVVGVVGYTARGGVFLLIGWFLVRAAWQYDPNEAVGLDGALAKLAHADYGPLLLGATGVGLLAYALFCVVQARYSKV
jgi:Domain of Unknown Function (DUF1206)